MDHFFSEFGGGEVEFVTKMVTDIIITTGLTGTNCNIDTSDERKRKKKKKVGWSGINSGIGSYFFKKIIYIFVFINNFFIS